MNRLNFMPRGRRFVLFAVFGGLMLLAGGTAQATLINYNALYIQSAISVVDPNKNVTVKAQFDDSGLTGVGTEKVQVSSLEFLFSVNPGTVRSPNIVIAPPDSSGLFPAGTFLAIFTDNVFKALASEDRGGGFANVPARIFPNIGPSTFVSFGTFSLIRNIGFTGSTRFNFESQTISIADPNLTPVPGPAAIWLFGTGLAGLGVLRSRRRKSSSARGPGLDQGLQQA